MGIRLYGINNMEREMMAVVILKASDDYLFVETDANGEAKSYNPSLVKGEHHHMITVRHPIHSMKQTPTITIMGVEAKKLYLKQI